jgi:hypothetical protein
MTPEELETKIDRALDAAIGCCTSAKEYTDLLKVAVEWYSQRQAHTGGGYGKALTRGAQNGG